MKRVLGRKFFLVEKLITLGLAFGVAITSSAGDIEVEKLPSLAQAVSNNAVALINSPQGTYLYSFLGLGTGKTFKDARSSATVLKPGAEKWQALPDVPGGSGRLAASAVSVGGAVWLFGGYTLAEDGSESSTPGVFKISPDNSTPTQVTEMPVAVEDAVIVPYLDRYIYLISGWHDLGNVNLVQVLDTQSMRWSQATPWPGTPVFGHAGGISGNQIVACDGVKIAYPSADTPREFLPADECWLGTIDESNFRRIVWQKIPAHPGKSRYRMAANGDDKGRVVFAGGSENPYNFNGVGYDGVPSLASKSVLAFDLVNQSWQPLGDLSVASMDHRGLLYADGWYYLVGGMHDPQKVVAEVYRFKLD
jgi:N-acetylneuraminic acid mutarotase